MSLCYACDSLATSVEHAPPKCIFPVGMREQLITVPSCETHNSEKSGNDEFLRNHLVVLDGTNEIGAVVLSGKAKRSIERNQSNIKNPMNSLRDPSRALMELDYPRVKDIFTLITKAIYLDTFGERTSSNWFILFENTNSFAGTSAGVEDMLKVLRNIDSFIVTGGANPKVFQFFIFQEREMQVFKYVFYGGVTVYACTNEMINESNIV